MKYLIGIICLIFSMSMNAQILTYSDGQIMYEDESIKTINITLDPQPKTVRSSFENWMDDKYDVDLDGKTLLFFDKEFMKAQGVVIPEISQRKIDLLVKVDETQTNATTLHVFASFGYNNWITLEDNPIEFLALESIVYDYVSDYLPEYYMDKVDNTEEALTDLNEDRVDLKSDVEDNEAEIAKLKKENNELMMKLKENQKKINSTKSKLTKRNKDYQSIRNRVKNK